MPGRQPLKLVVAIGVPCSRISLTGLIDGAAKLRSRLAALLAAAAVAGLPAVATAYETDQFTNRDEPIADSTEILNRKMNETIEGIVDGWKKGHDEMAVVSAIYHEIGGHHWVDKLERWAMKSDEVEKLDTPRYDSVFSGLPIYASRVTFFFGVGKTIRLNDQLIGTDKIGHFLSQGRKYYRRYNRSDSEAQAAERSAYTERAIFGRVTTGSYSNADLVANYEGHRFYRSLFEDDIVPGKLAILRWEDDGWIIQRNFDWADHVNEYWDEALNVSHFDALLYKHMHERLVSLCPLYWDNPELYTIENEAPLKVRYAHLELLDTRELRLDSLCPVQEFLTEKSLRDAPASP
jgi:hypothetical protein